MKKIVLKPLLGPIFAPFLALLTACAGDASGTDRQAEAPESEALRFAHTVETTAPPEAVWSQWMDVEQWPTWDTELRSSRLKDPMAQGARGRLVPKKGVPSNFVISEFVPLESYAFTTKLPGASLTVRRTLAATAEGGTSFTHEVSFEGPKAERWARRLSPSFRAALPGVMDTLADVAEAGSLSR